MPTGPQGQHRPADVVGCAVMVARIATGEIEDEMRPAAKPRREIGALGGKARAHRLTAAQRSAIARNAAQARWADNPKNSGTA